MPKKSFQDVVKIKRINRDMLPEKMEKTEHKESHLLHHLEKHIEKHKTLPHHSKENKSNINSKYTLWFVALVSVVFLLFALSFLFSRAKVTVNPKMQDLVLDENLSATKDSSTDGLAFQLISLSDKEIKTVPGGEQKDVSVKAKGTIVIYNAFSSKPQPLNINTRLEGSNGKMYMTDIKVIVPGIAKDNTPGHVEVSISGAGAGEEYNSGPLDFKIFGFKGTPKYTKIYAISNINDKTTSGKITGGLKGSVGQISDADKLTIVNDLKTTLQAKLFKKATEQIPSEYILFKDAVFFKNDDPTFDFVPTGSQVTVGVNGTLYGFFFNEKDLTKKIAEDSVDKYDGSDVYVSKIKDLIFTLANKDNISYGDVKNINFSLTGNTKIVWKVDSDKLIDDLLGSTKKDFNGIFSKYINIDSADLVLRPAWKSSLPSTRDKIDILVKDPL